MIFLELFLSFLKVGFSSFGGLSMVPVINAEMLSHGWMTQEQVIDIIAIAEMTPGPMDMNCATFAGMRVAGVPGALMANLGVLAPTLTLTLAVAVCFERFRKSRGNDKGLWRLQRVHALRKGPPLISFSRSMSGWSEALGSTDLQKSQEE